MNDFYTLPLERKRLILSSAETKIGLPAAAIEKDLWVTCVLQLLFSIDIHAEFLFKGGTSLSKAGNLIQRFSEDIDIAINPAVLGFSGDLTKKQIKRLRKASSLFVEQTLAVKLREVIQSNNLHHFLTVDVEPEGEGDATYPEPRRIFVRYPSIVSQQYDYLKDTVVLEIGARSLMEPVQLLHVKSLVEANFPNIRTSVQDPAIATSTPAKTFLEKAFLLHELFSVNEHAGKANHRSRHLYDLERMMDMPFAVAAINDNDLWESIQHHRSIYTAVQNVDYTKDLRKEIVLVPPANVIAAWETDYNDMCQTMIYGEKLSFALLLERICELEIRFHNLRN